MNYDLVRYADRPRTATIAPSPEEAGSCQPQRFSTIAAHLYQGAYFPGTRPRAAADGTRFRAFLDGDILAFELVMEEPALEELLRWLPENSSKDFWDTDFVGLHFIDADDRVVQVAFKLTGEVTVRRDFEEMDSSSARIEVETGEAEWQACLDVPLGMLGYDSRQLNSAPIPFDLVRFHSSNGATTAWSPIPDQLPFNENYRYPVFCFGLLSTQSVEWDEYAGTPADLGTFRYDGPDRITAGTYTSFAVEYTVGEHGFPAGAALKFNFSNEVIECNRNSSRKRPLPEKDWSPLQWDNPRKPGYLDVTCSRGGANIELEGEDVFSTKAVLGEGNELQPGDRIRIAVGEAEQCPGIRAQLLSQGDFPLKVFADLAGNGMYRPPEEFPRVDVVGGPATALLVHCPPTPDPEETVRLTVTAVDNLGNVADGYTGEVALQCPVEAEGLPEACLFYAEHGGTRTFDVCFEEEDVFQVLARDIEQDSLNGASNLIVTDGSFAPGRIYFGDIHTHSQLSDGRLHPEQKVREVAHHRGLDFWSLTDHGHDFNVERLQQLHRTIGAHNEDGRFATVYGFEWTNSMGRGTHMRKAWGHRNIYFRQAPQIIHDGVRLDSSTPERVHARYEEDGVDFFCINHFHCGDPITFPEVDRAAEASGWCGEFSRDDLARSDRRKDNIFDALDQGLRGGITAGTDHGTEAYYTRLPAEMTAVHADALTREEVYGALESGRTYGTSGQKTLLRFTVNGQAPDSTEPPITADERELRIVVGSAYPVKVVQVIRNRTMWRRLNGFDYGVKTYTLTDSDGKPEEGYYLIRVLTAQGHKTWSSPIFFGR